MILLEKIPFKNKGYRFSKLKEKEQVQTFLLILSCFSIAEQRRKSICDADKENCNHWWHRNLSDPEIIRGGKAIFSWINYIINK